MALQQWEIQFLVFIAKNKDHREASEFLAEQRSDLSDDACAMAEAMIQGGKAIEKLTASRRALVEDLLSRADAVRNERIERFERRSRLLAHV
jgi:hypothetical protein